MSRATLSDLHAVAEAQLNEWPTLFGLAGFSAPIVVALIPVQRLVSILWPPPTTAVDYFTVFEGSPLQRFLDLTCFWLSTSYSFWSCCSACMSR